MKNDDDYKDALENLASALEELIPLCRADTTKHPEWKAGYEHIANQVIDTCIRAMRNEPAKPLPVIKPSVPVTPGKVIAFRKHTYKAD